MPDGMSYAAWKKMSESASDVMRNTAIWKHVVLYDILGRASLIRGEMVASKIASGLFFPEPPPQEQVVEEPAETGPQPVAKAVSKRWRRRE